MPRISKNIICAESPKRIRRKKERVEHPNLPTVITALSPKEIEKRKRAEALLAKVQQRVVNHNNLVPEVDPEISAPRADTSPKVITSPAMG